MGSFTPSNPYKTIILVGPSGSLGTVLLEGLLFEPTFTISVLVREASKSIASLIDNPDLNVIKISDDYPYDRILTAFQGQDAVVNAITSTGVKEQFKFIDAAVEAGMKRYVPSEYGLNYLRPQARAFNAVFDGKGRVQEYLESQEPTGLTWNAINCGVWIDWTLKNSFLGLDYATRTMTFADEGRGKFSTSTMANTALALNRYLLNPELTKNQVVYISDFATTQSELVAVLERVEGKQWTRKSVDSVQVIEEYKKRYAEGEHLAVYKLIEMGFATGKYGG